MKNLYKIIEYGLYLLVFLLPLGTRWIIKAGFTEYQTYSLYGADVILISLLLLYIAFRFFYNKFTNYAFVPSSGRGELRITNYGLTVVGLLLISFISIFFASDKALAVYKFGWLAAGMGLFWLIRKADYNRAKLLLSLFAGLALQAGLAIYQFLTQLTFENKWLGLALHSASDLGTSVVETIGPDGVGERWLRAYGGFDHPNILGGVMALGIMLIVWEIVKNDKFSPRPDFGTKAIFRWALLILFSASLFFSFSRAAWLALAVGLAAMMTVAVIRKNLEAEKSILQAVLVSGVIFFILFLQYPNLIMTRLYAGDRLEIKSTEERIESVKNSLPIIKKNWLIGTGIGNYVIALKENLPGQINYFYQPAHNTFILVFSETGIAGLVLFLFLIIYLIILNWKLEIGKDKNIDNLAFNISVLISLVVLLSLDHWLWSLHFGVLFFWLTLGLISHPVVDK